MLQEFFNSLQQHGFLAGPAAEALTVALGFPAHRKTLMKAYSSYIQGDITVVQLREELRAVSDDVSVGGSAVANAQKLVNYVKGVAADGFLSSGEEKFLTDAIRAGSSQLLNLFARAQALGDSTVLNRGLVDAARAFSVLSTRTPLDDLDLSSGSDDADDEGDEDVDTDSGEDEEQDDDADERLPRSGRPSNPTPSASELIRIIDRMYEDGSISNGILRLLC